MGDTKAVNIGVNCLASILVLAGVASAQTPVRYRQEWHRAPFLNLSDAKTVPARYAGAVTLAQARALSTAAADFDEDGMPDLAAGFATPRGGAVAIHRGNVDALWPYGKVDPPAFLPGVRVFALPEAADFLAAGDFDADGHWDLVAARTGSDALWYLKGDGHGGFADARRIALAGRVTAMTSGEINRTDGLTDLMVAIAGGAGPQALVFESPDGALRGDPEAFPLPAEAGALAVFPMDGGLMNGLAVAAGRELLLIHPRDRHLTRSKEVRGAVPAAAITHHALPFAPRALAVGSFTSPTFDLAALGDDGRIHILESSDARAPRPKPEFVRKPGVGLAPKVALGKTSAMAESHAIDLPLTATGEGVRLVTARVAASGHDSLIVLDPAANKLHVVSHASREDAKSMGVSASLDVAGAPAAVQAMRINKDALSDLVVLTAAQSEPVAMTTSPNIIYTVINTTAGANGSLDQELAGAGLSATNGDVPEVDFNIPVTDPDRDPTTGVFEIQPVQVSPPSEADGVGDPGLALPILVGGITVDGYTQPGASPNTLAIGDNAQLLIEIDGSLTEGPDGFVLFGAANTIRGMIVNKFPGFFTPLPLPTTTGGSAIYIASSGHFIEGNFLGIDASGTIGRANFIGLEDQGGQLGNTIGGTTPQARNLFGACSYGDVGMAVSAFPNVWLFQGNYVGTDKTGTKAINFGRGGVALPGFNAVVGGTTAGAANVISGNYGANLNIEFGCTDCSEFNIVQGNFIGTDPTGTKAVSTVGYGVDFIEAADNTLGGTTPAARNIISGNGEPGLWFAGGSTNNLVEGNYIGTDISGTQALGNAGVGVLFGVGYDDVYGNFVPGTPSLNNVIGGEAGSSGNVISSNSSGGVEITSAGTGIVQGNVIAGNLIGTDASGANPLGNGGDGILIHEGAANNIVGGGTPGAGNAIANNKGNGVENDPGSNVVSTNSIGGNAIYANTGAGVSITSGSQNAIRGNRIYSNGGLGIELGGGLVQNSACQANTAGPNLLQDAPVLTAGTGSTFVTATATDPYGNTSEFSNCVAASLASNVLTIGGTLNSLPKTTYTIDYFSNPSCDPSGFGEGQVYLGSATYTTDNSCNASLNAPLNLTNADLAVSSNESIYGVTQSATLFMAVVTNKGPAPAASVTFSDTLQAGVNFVSVSSNQGSCGFANGTISCNLGAVPVGVQVTITVWIVPTNIGPYSNTITVSSPTPDSNLANNTFTVTTNPNYAPYLDHLNPASVYAGSPATSITLVGTGFTSSTAVTYGGVAYPATFSSSTNSSVCGFGSTFKVQYCTTLTITVPASQLTAAGTVQVSVAPGGTLPFHINTLPIAIGPATHFVLSSLPNPYPAGSQQLLTVTAEDANGNVVQAYTGAVNLTSSDPAPTVFTGGGGSATLTFTSTQGGAYTTAVELQTFGTQSITATDASNASITGTLNGIVVSNGPAANLALTGSPQATPPGHAFAQPLTVKVTDAYGNVVPNQAVTFTPPTTGASATLSSTTATTNALGVASVTATANAISGAYEVGVTAGSGSNPDVFLLNNGTGLATLTATSGTPQTTLLGTLFANPLVVTLLDGLGNPIVGANVNFSGPSVLAVTSLAVTNSSGMATTKVNSPLNAVAGTYSMTAEVGGLTATFTLTEQALIPVVVTITGGSPQSTSIGAPFPAPLAVKVTDSTGAPKSGVVVTFLAPTSGASAALSADSVTADYLGNASVTAIANSTLGSFNATASVDGVTATFALTNTKPIGGMPTSISAYGGTPQSQAVATAFTTALKALVKDSTGTPVSGASVTFGAPATGASGTFTGSATVLTDGTGVATAPAFTANTVVGSYMVTATVGSLSTTFNLTNVAGPATALTIYSGNNQSATINTNFGTSLAVQFVDAYGNPTTIPASNVTGSLTVEAGTTGASGNFNGSTSISPNANGIATAPSLTANGSAGAWSVFAFFIQELPTFQTFSAFFTLTNTASVPANLAVYAGANQSTSVNTAFPLPLSARVTDSGGNPLAGFTVTFTPATSAATAVLSAASAITNASGVAAVNATANASAGAYNVTASIGALNTTFHLTNTAVALNRCDVNVDGAVNIQDVQIMINEALGLAAALNDLTSDGLLNVIDIQIVVDAADGLGCSAH